MIGLGILGLFLALFWGYALWEGWFAARHVVRLLDHPPRDRTAWPSVRLVAAARNEAGQIEAAVRSWLQLAYPRLEIVVVDDRSEDKTYAILQRLRARDPRLEVRRVEHLPPGWLGKNHALHIGARDASTDWLLFTDADVHLAPHALAHAVAWAEAQGLDHLAVTPDLERVSFLVDATVTFFALLFHLTFRPARAVQAHRREFVGIGAFNLVRTRVYHAVGGHTAIALRPDDDAQLGKRVKEAGYHQALARGQGLVRVCWYRSLADMARGMEKNSLAGLDYRADRVVLHGLLFLITQYGPLVGVLLAPGPARLAFGFALVLLLVTAGWNGRKVMNSTLLGVIGFFPGSLLFLVIFIRAVLRTIWRGGIEWRGTFYSLRDLRRGHGTAPGAGRDPSS